MKKILITLVLFCTMNSINAQNPFLEKYQTPYATVPFNLIKEEHYEPAFDEGIRRQNQEIDAIVNNSEAPTFENTIEAFERSGELLDRVNAVFSNMLGAETNDELQDIAQRIMPLLSEHSNNITLNEKLFKRVKCIYEQKEKLELSAEQSQLLDNIYDSFIRHGANLEGDARKKYRELTGELSRLTLTYNDNTLKETNQYKLVLTNEKDLKGLPEIVVEAAEETAKNEGIKGWVFTLHAPSYIPFLTYADNRELRQQLYMAYNTKCTHNDPYNNLDIVRKIVNTRMQIAQLLGYNNFAEYSLKKRMAENSERVYTLFDQLLESYTPTAQAEYEEVSKFARAEQGNQFVVMPWDWSYYSNKLKDQKYNINEEMLRPYFELSQVKKGVFGLAEKLYGIRFKLNPEIPVYHPEVEAYEVYDQNNKLLAIFYADFHPRAGKRSGAWMTSFKEQWIVSESTCIEFSISGTHAD